LATQFVLLKVATDDRQMWSEWSRKYKHDGTGIPIVYVIRADGQMLYGKSGTPAPLPLFLVSALKQGGQLLPEKQLQSLQRNLQTVEQLRKAGQTEAAVGQLRRNLGTGSFSSVAVASAKLEDELTAEATEALQEAIADMNSETERLSAAIRLVRIDRDYGALPQMRKPLAVALKQHRTQVETRELLKQAEILLKAQTLQGTEKWRQALASYQLVIDRYPKTPASALASREMDKLRSQSTAAPTTPDSKGKPKPTRPSSPQDKQAASLLRLGKLLLKRNPTKARSYFMRVITTAPDSEAAREARALLAKSR
jgi:TolA-binding protein